ncbi:MAG: GNAT family N-acetyltransferase [Parachlamydiales bacterium]|jgi:putative acetyltransferase
MNKHKIEIHTERLILRNIDINDLNQLMKCVNNIKIAEMMNGSILVPYTKVIAVNWINKHQLDSINSQCISWAIAKKEDNQLMGSIQLRLNTVPTSAYLSYWLGENHWGKGYMYEAGQKVISFAFEKMQIDMILAECLKRNIASRKVLLKLGFIHQDDVLRIEKFFKREEVFEQYHLNNLTNTLLFKYESSV